MINLQKRQKYIKETGEGKLTRKKGKEIHGPANRLGSPRDEIHYASSAASSLDPVQRETNETDHSGRGSILCGGSISS